MNEMKKVVIEKLIAAQSVEFMEILWTALNPEGVTGRSRSLLYDTVIKPYYEDWGRPDDIGFAAVIDGRMVGAAWSRVKSCVTKEYKEYPELAIGVLTDYQNQGIGSRLIKAVIETCRGKYPGIRLGVNKKAVRVLSFYYKFGFVEYDKYNDSTQIQLTFK